MLRVYTPITGHKPKLSKRFSWPIGLEALSAGLASVPQFNDLSVWYDDRPLDYQWTMDKIADKGMPYQILTVWYTLSGRSPEWYIMVYPVERSLRKELKAMLETIGLQQIYDWMSRSWTEVELQSSHHYRCIYDPVSRTLDFKQDKG